MRGLVLIFLAVAFVAASAGPAGASTALGEGDDFDAVTDQEGTTHVVWDESAANQDDKLGYCRVKRGETTCGDLRTLEPKCPRPQDGSEPEAAAKRDHASSGEHGDGPSIGISPFGDVVITTHGLCSYPWRLEYPASSDPNEEFWHEAAAVDWVLSTHSTDDGDTFGDWGASGLSRPWGPRNTTSSTFQDYGEPSDVSTSLYDFADSRPVTVGTANGPALLTSGSPRLAQACAGVHTGHHPLPPPRKTPKGDA